MIAEFTKDTKRRKCAICSKNIKKGSKIIKYPQIIDSFGNTRLWFAHIECLIKKLIIINTKMEKELNKIPKTNYRIGNSSPK